MRPEPFTPSKAMSNIVGGPQPIIIPLSCLAEYMTSGYARQRTVLQEFKYPQSDTSQARIKYYQDARDTLYSYHKNHLDRSWLTHQAVSLESLSAVEQGNRRTRLEHNARALRAYEKFFGSKSYEVLTLPKWKLTFSSVKVVVRPDLYVAENDLPKAIKFEFGTKVPKPELIKIISQCMLEAAHQAGNSLPSGSVLFFDVPRGAIHKGARIGALMKRNIEAACLSIEAIWPTI